MQPENFKFGGGGSETLLHPVVLVAMLLAIVLVFLLPRRYVIVPVLCIVLLTPLGQQLYVAGLHIYVFRIVILFGWVRLLCLKFASHTSLLSGRWNSVDTAFVSWALFRSTAFLLLFQDTGAVINQFGFLWGALGGYFLLRILIRDDEDVQRVIRVLASVAAIVALGMLNEKFRGQNLFGFFGSLPIVARARDGAIRAQGPFAHAILAGTFGATLLPLFFWLWKSGKSNLLAAGALISSTAITMTTASSTPLLAYVAAIMAICFWPFRKRMRAVRWGIAITLVVLQLMMKAPVWYLIAHMDVIGASSGYQRAFLIDQFIRNFGQWWLIGTAGNAKWGWDMWDTSNGYVAEGVTGGLMTLLCFLVIICFSFSRLGKARKSIEGDRREEWFLWLLGSALFAHVVAFFGISYFDQTQIAWFSLLATISAATAVRIAQPLKSPALVLQSASLSYNRALPPGVSRAGQ